MLVTVTIILFAHSAYTYEAYFDELLEDDNPLTLTTTTTCTMGTTTGATMEDDMQPTSYTSSHPPTSLPLSLHNNNNNTATNEDNNSNSNSGPSCCEMEKRASKDSGTGGEFIMEEMTPYGRMSSSGLNSDSGLDTPYMAEGQILSAGSNGKSIFTFASHPEESSAEYTDTDHRGKGRRVGLF